MEFVCKINDKPDEVNNRFHDIVNRKPPFICLNDESNLFLESVEKVHVSWPANMKTEE